MELDKMLLDDFAEITHDKKEKLQDVTCYGTAVVQEGTEYVRLDAADSLTPATFAVRAHHGDRVMVMIKNHRATVIANITTPSMTLGILNVTDGIIVQGYLTTNEERTAYDDQNHYGLTFSAGGIGGYGGSGKYWYLTNAGDLYASSAEIVGNITAESGYLGSKTNGFKIDQYGIYSGNDKSGTSNGYIVLANGDFARTINGTPHADLRFAIGANFGVSSSGVLYASNVDISGTVKASLGEIGGFEIDSTSIHTKGVAVTVNAENSVGLSSSTFKRTIGGKERSNLKFAIGSNFGVDSTGKLYGSNIEVSGKIDATSGTIGSGTNKIDIGAGSIHYLMTSLADTTHDGFYIGTDGIALGKGKFKVTDAGKLTATGADIGGKITATDGSIAGWQIGTSAIYRGTNATDTSFNTSGALYFGTQGLSLSDKFSVTSAGALTAISGNIGGWIIGANTLQKETGATTTTGTYQYKVYLHAPNSPTSGSNVIAVQRKLHGASDYDTNSLFAVTYGGYIKAVGGGTIGSWTLGASGTTNSQTVGSLYYCPSGKSFGQDGTIYLIPHGTTVSTTIAGRAGTDWVVTAGSKFGVTNSGALYASSATVSGTITATTGEIGGFEIDSTSIHTKNTTSTTTTANAFYLSSSTFKRAIAGYTINNLKIAIGDGFAIDSEGSVCIGRWANLIIQNVASSTQLSGGYWINDYTYASVGGLTGLVYKNSSGSITGRALELRSRDGSDLNITSINNISITGSRPTASWVNSIALPALHVTPSGTDGAICGMTMKTKSGYVGLCTYPSNDNDNKLYVKYITNDNYNNRVNTTVRASVDCNITGHADGDLATTGGSLSGALSVSGNISSTNEIHAGGKGSASDGNTGSILSTAGHLYMQGASGSHIYFYYGTSTSVTSQLYESASGTLRVSGDFTVDGVVRTPSTWSNTTTNSANVRVIDQYGQLQRYSSSSKRYKHDIVAITDYKKVLDIPVVTFKYNKGYISDKDQRFGLSIPGFIAEEVEKCYPIAAEMVDGKIEDWNARYIIPPMLAVEQEHERRIKELEHQINELKAEIAALKGVA